MLSICKVRGDNLKSVILIDDEPRFIEDMALIIKSHPGFHVVASANSGREGKLAIQHHRPDLVIMDIMMPDDDGLEVIRYIREECGQYNPYIYVITAMETPSVKRILEDLKVDFVSFKPKDERKVVKNLDYIDQAESKPLVQHLPSNKLHPVDAIDEIMDELEIPSHLIGNEYIKTALLFMLDDPILKRNVYKKVADVFKCTNNNVAANINNAIKACMGSEMYRAKFGEDKAETLLFLNHLAAIIKKRLRGNGKN